MPYSSHLQSPFLLALEHLGQGIAYSFGWKQWHRNHSLTVWALICGVMIWTTANSCWVLCDKYSFKDFLLTHLILSRALWSSSIYCPILPISNLKVMNLPLSIQCSTWHCAVAPVLVEDVTFCTYSFNKGGLCLPGPFRWTIAGLRYVAPKQAGIKQPHPRIWETVGQLEEFGDSEKSLGWVEGRKRSQGMFVEEGQDQGGRGSISKEVLEAQPYSALVNIQVRVPRWQVLKVALRFLACRTC